MLISVHAPKTAGTSFRLLIERNVHDAAAFDYGESPASTEVVRNARRALEAGGPEAARALLDAAGVELIHGHRAIEFAPLYPGAPAVVWLRDPLQRSVSEYLQHRRTPDSEHALGMRIAAGDVSFEDCLQSHATYYQDLLRALADRPLAVLVTDDPAGGALAFHEALGWRGDLVRRNSAPAPDAKEARGLVAAHAHARDGVLAAETALYADHLARWRSGAGLAEAVEALRGGPRRRPAPLLSAARARLARRTLGAWREAARRWVRRSD